MTEVTLQNYHLFRPKILDLLENRDWFIECMTCNFYFIGKRYGCIPIISRRRMGEAYDYWQEDVNRTLALGIQKTTELDHFKHASFIAFWLRRTLPINEIRLALTIIEREKNIKSDKQKKFLRYGSEICALHIGFMLCLFFEECSVIANEIEGGRTVYGIISDRTTYLKKCQLKQPIVDDYTMIMKHKNMSPHGIYLLYKSLFTNLMG